MYELFIVYQDLQATAQSIPEPETTATFSSGPSSFYVTP